ncbi:type II toxin-antitoxin system YhaV family toxin [Massilia sp. W12]|uniref:type II toxin-antitoxin system YhaV family toxin n=1 Tax=Massilia sp. W12 TaxID=3126507 RepID=UPI0030D13D59
MSAPPLQINGWRIYAHPLFIQQVQALAQQVQALQSKYPQAWREKNAAKRLAAILKLAFESIPQDPARAEFRQGNTLGAAGRHWMRAKFFQQYRLFFRFHAGQKVIVLAWVNDDSCKRAYGSKDDAYGVFRSMFERGHPPNDWDGLLKEAKTWDGL